MLQGAFAGLCVLELNPLWKIFQKSTILFFIYKCGDGTSNLPWHFEVSATNML